MTAIIDYDAGNLKSVEKALQQLGETPVITRDKEVLLSADKVILPGVGSFGDAMDKLNRYELVPVIREICRRNTPFLGICLGLQLLYEASEESPGVEGLGILPGTIRRIPSTDGLKIPHVGWNSLKYPYPSPLFEGIPEDSFVYFVHSYYAPADKPEVCAQTEYGIPLTAAVRKGNVFAVQFHPEKSSRTGLAILRNFAALS